MKTTLTAALLLAFAAPGFGQVVAVPSRCDDMTKPVMEAIKKLPFPVGWKIVVACNDITWENLRRHAGNPKTKVAFTSLDAHITIVNGNRMQFPEPLESPQRVLAHELEHIRCNCSLGETNH